MSRAGSVNPTSQSGEPRIWKVRATLGKSLDSLVNLSAERAREVLRSDDEIDAMNRRTYRIVQEAIHAHPDQTDSLIHMLSAARHLERIADHDTNIAEDVIYMIEGAIVRHRHSQAGCHRVRQRDADSLRVDAEDQVC